MSSPNHCVAEDRDNEPNSAPKLLLQGPEGDQAGASLDKLRGEWRRLYHCEPPRISRDLLLRGIAYRRQELKHGGEQARPHGVSSLSDDPLQFVLTYISVVSST